MDVVSRCSLPVASVLWQPRPSKWALTFVCKATYLLAPTESELAEEQEAPNEYDNHWNDDTTRSLYAASDLVPFKARADVILVGHAFAPRREPTRALVASVLVGSMNKAIECACDRGWTLDGQLREGPRFTKMPLRYERAAGGPETSNPVGVRHDAADAYGVIHLPNLLPPGNPVPQRGEAIDPIGFGPIAPTWPSRVDKLGRHAASWFNSAWTSQPVPEDLEPGYFNCAPLDQQISSIRPTERIILENLHPEHTRLVTNLPGTTPIAILERPGAAPEEVRLKCDTLWIDTDRSLCTLVWRGRISLEHHAQPGCVAISIRAAAGAREERVQTTRLAVQDVAHRAAMAAGKPAEAAKSAKATAPNEPQNEDDETFVVDFQSEMAAGALPFIQAGAKRPNEPNAAAPPFARPAQEEEVEVSTWHDTTAVSHGRPMAPPLPFMHAGKPAPKPALPFQKPTHSPSSPPIDPNASAARPVDLSAPQPPPMTGAQTPPAPPPLVRLPQTMDPVAAPPSSPWATGSRGGPSVGASLLPSRVQPAPSSIESTSGGATFLPKFEPPAATPPNPAVTAAAATAGAAAASNAAAWSARPAATTSSSTTSLAAQASRGPTRDILTLLWFDPAFVKPLSENPRWAEIIEQPDEDPDESSDSDASGKKKKGSPKDSDEGESSGDDDQDMFDDNEEANFDEPPPEKEEVPPEVRDKRNVFKVIARGEPMSASGINQKVADSIKKDGTLEPPLVLVAGELVFPFDELETLKANVTAVSPLVAGDKKLKEVVDTVNELLKTPWLSRSGSVAEGLTVKIKEAFSQGNRMLPPSYLESHTERMLLEDRHYQKRTIFGQVWIRSLFVPASSQDPIPAYLPESLSKQLPMFLRLKTRLIAEVHMQQDQYESNPIALRVVALARVTALPSGGGGAKP